MSDLVEWLTKILDEDEAKFAQACEAEAAYCRSDGIPDMTAEQVKEYWLSLGDQTEWPWKLADIAAKRAIIDEYVARDKDADLMLGPDCLRQREWSGLRLAVQIIATGYAERPGYRDEWRPLSMRTHP